jgi:uncharacterized tellurite resistance protein B-like protein
MGAAPLWMYARTMLFQWLFGEKQDSAATASGELLKLVAHSMPGADADTAAVIGATAGLLATVAHADRNYTEAEREAVRDALSKVQGLGSGAFTAIEELLAERVGELAHESIQTFTRVLYEKLERSARLEVFEALMDLAAADEVLDMQETNLLRRIARALGLSDPEYNASQARHRQRLSILRPPRSS